MYLESEKKCCFEYLFLAAENKYSKQHFFFNLVKFGDIIAHWYMSTYEESEGENKSKKESITRFGLMYGILI